MAQQEGTSSHDSSLPEGAIRTMHQDLERLRSEQTPEEQKAQPEVSSGADQVEESKKEGAQESKKKAASEHKDKSEQSSAKGGLEGPFRRSILAVATVAVLATAVYAWTLFGLTDDALSQWNTAKQWVGGVVQDVKVSVFSPNQQSPDASPDGGVDSDKDQQDTSTPGSTDPDSGTSDPDTRNIFPADRIAVITLDSGVSTSTISNSFESIQSNVEDNPGEFVLVELRNEAQQKVVGLSDFLELLGFSENDFMLSEFLQDNYSVFWQRGDDGRYYPGLVVALDEPDVSGEFAKIVPAFRQNSRELGERFVRTFIPGSEQNSELSFTTKQFDVEAIIQRQQEQLNGRQLHMGLFFQDGWLVITSSQVSFDQLLQRLP